MLRLFTRAAICAPRAARAAPRFAQPFRRSLTSVQPVARRRRWPLVLLAGVCGAYGYWKYITYHRFPPTVAALLKEGLWATINGAGYRQPDYRQALSKYIEALQEADRLDMIPWSDEYTGIQFIIADLYERMGLVEEAASMYVEVAGVYMMALKSGKISERDRPKIIARDLRVVLLAGLLISTDAARLKSVVGLAGSHLLMALHEASAKNPELNALLKSPFFNPVFLNNISLHPALSAEFADCYDGYKDEVFALREMITGIEAASGEYMDAVMGKLKTTQLMLRSGYPLGECLLSAVNVASLLYLQSMSMRYTPRSAVEATAAVAAGKPAATAAVPAAVPAVPAGGSGSGSGSGDLAPTTAAASSSASAGSAAFVKQQQMCFAWSQTMFDNIITTIKSLDQKRTDFIPEAYAMAIYGRGVVAASAGDWEKASSCFDEARLRARGNEIQSLLDAVEGELAKVDKLRALSEDELRELDPGEIPSVNIMFWKLSPDIGDIDRPELPDTPL